MAGNVVINGRTAVHAGSQGQLTTVDVCNTPPYCRSVPYNNIAMSQDTAMGATSVMVNGNPACNQTSNFAVSAGDEGGSCGGVASGVIKQMAEFVTFSANVMIEGIPAVRQMDLMTSNLKNTPPMPLQQPGAGMPPPVAPKGAKDSTPTEQYSLGVTVVGKALHSMSGFIEVDDPSKA